MVCPSCGHEVSEGANFCLNCGAKLEMEAAETQAPMEQVSQGAETQTQEEKRSTASKAIFIQEKLTLGGGVFDL